MQQTTRRSFENIMDNVSPLVLSLSIISYITNIAMAEQQTFSSGSSRHGNAQRAPVDWNWVNLANTKLAKQGGKLDNLMIYGGTFNDIRWKI